MSKPDTPPSLQLASYLENKVDDAQLLFMFFTLSETEGIETIGLDSVLQVKGRMKSQPHQHLGEHLLRLTWLDESGTTADTLLISHPLHEEIETTNDEGKWIHHDVEHEQKSFTVRVAFQPWFHSLRIESSHFHQPFQLVNFQKN